LNVETELLLAVVVLGPASVGADRQSALVLVRERPEPPKSSGGALMVAIGGFGDRRKKHQLTAHQHPSERPCQGTSVAEGPELHNW
jgi:hypothetical protein